jgi:hypothetical protein
MMRRAVSGSAVGQNEIDRGAGHSVRSSGRFADDLKVQRVAFVLPGVGGGRSRPRVMPTPSIRNSVPSRITWTFPRSTSIAWSNEGASAASRWMAPQRRGKPWWRPIPNPTARSA